MTIAIDALGNEVEPGDEIIAIFKPTGKPYRLLLTEAVKVSGSRIYFNVPPIEARWRSTEEYTTSDRVISLSSYKASLGYYGE